MFGNVPWVGPAALRATRPNAIPCFALTGTAKDCDSVKWYWPKLTDLKESEKAAHEGAGVCFLVAGGTAIIDSNASIGSRSNETIHPAKRTIASATTMRRLLRAKFTTLRIIYCSLCIRKKRIEFARRKRLCCRR
jgi:hypothetical protein